MSRLIDADALRKKISDVYENKNIYQMIDEVSTVDAVSVVRCKDCKWWDKLDGTSYGYCQACKHWYMSDHWEISIYRTYEGDWFCADGERREDDASYD